MKIFRIAKGALRRCVLSARWLTQHGLLQAKVPYFHFIKPHTYLSSFEISLLHDLLLSGEDGSVCRYEQLISSYMEGGHVVATASGRMGLYSLLQAYGIKKDDEVIITGFTCAVVPNAVMRLGAKPVYADIDINTLGTCPRSVEKLISSKTKAIVAQHSFGIPCEIDALCGIAQKYGIVLIEDVAISFGSEYKGKKLGTWGDSAFFSTDHSKPMNTLVGGFSYTKNDQIFSSLRKQCEAWGDLPYEKQEKILEQILYEKKWLTPDKMRSELLFNIWRRRKGASPFLDADGSEQPHSVYPYPARLPGFLAQLGIFEIERWATNAKSRTELLKFMLDCLASTSLTDCIPNAYNNSDNTILPLRLALVLKENDSFKKLKVFFPPEWIWFQSPIVSCSSPMSSLGYVDSMCPVSEYVGRNIINWPCAIPEDFEQMFKDAFLKWCKEF